ncbi:BTAD domain-containing putative transcriptional regulator [Longispora albida]|uniref:BTAD domain-containing putative transcriptional regulator n=1 Tax=Longispora albida TaxID=203523 RepID=UPI00039B3DDC|nr:BTAD domain-containing putative transcriptional regulator [Longispora albida]
MVRIFLLGGVRVAGDDGAPVDAGQARSQVVLAALALSPGMPLTVPRIIDLVWGTGPPRTAAKTLQWHIAKLRRALGTGTIVRAGDAYLLAVPPAAVDVSRFQQYLRDGDPGAALAEWGGPPLAGLDAPGLAATTAGLTEQWLTAVESDLERRAVADPRGVLGDLAGLTQQYPERENFWALLMTALYQTGRQSEALAAYQRARAHLVTELGVEPGPALRTLESRILSQDGNLEGRTPGGNLPARGTRLFGRDADLAAVTAALGTSPVVTLTGPGGIGKTQLGLAAARAFAAVSGGGAWLVELAGITAPEDVPRAAADALGVPQRPGLTLTASIVAALRGRPGLLVADNCEHVLAEAAALVQAIVDGCPQVRVLATSRERLALADEQVVTVEPLGAAAGTELFHARALATGHAYDPRAQQRYAAEICRQLDGIPLAIELAAARTVSHDPAGLAARLGDQLRVTGARRTGTARHRTLRAAIQWSYDLLTPAERTLFEDLSVFGAPFSLDAAEAVGSGPDSGMLLGTLAERSMVTVHTGQPGRRFRLLETMRQFAAGYLAARGGTAEAAGRHARWCAGEVLGAGRLLAGMGEAEGVARLAELWPHLRTAVTQACAAGDAELAGSLVRPVVTELPLRGRQEIGDWAEQILPLAGSGTERAFWLVWVAERYTQNANPAAFREVAARFDVAGAALGRYAAAYASGDGEGLWRCLPEAVAELRGLGEPDLAAFLEMTSAGPLLGTGRFAEVDASVAALAGRYRAAGPPALLHWALQTLGYSAAFQGLADEPDRYFDEAAQVRLPPGTLSANKSTEARSAFRRGERQRAYELLLSHVEELADTGNVVAASVVCIEFVNMMAAAGHEAQAAHMLAYLAQAGDFGALAARALVSEAARAIGPAGQITGDRAALGYMRDVLVRLVQAPHPAANAATSAATRPGTSQ